MNSDESLLLKVPTCHPFAVDTHREQSNSMRLARRTPEPAPQVDGSGAPGEDQKPGSPQYLETFISSICPVTMKTTRSQMLVMRSAIRSRLWAAHRRKVARFTVPGS